MLFRPHSSKPKLSSGVCSCLRVAGDSIFRTEGPSSPCPKAQKVLTEAEEEGTFRVDFLSLSPFWDKCVCVLLWEASSKGPCLALGMLCNSKGFLYDGHLNHTKSRSRKGIIMVLSNPLQLYSGSDK